MTTGFALEYIERRMVELGFGENYMLRYRHIQLMPSENKRISAHRHYFYLIDPNEECSVRSTMGIYDVADTGVNEMQYEHRGKLIITNNSKEYQLLKFIQVIPKKV